MWRVLENLKDVSRKETITGFFMHEKDKTNQS